MASILDVAVVNEARDKTRSKAGRRCQFPN